MSENSSLTALLKPPLTVLALIAAVFVSMTLTFLSMHISVPISDRLQLFVVCVTPVISFVLQVVLIYRFVWDSAWGIFLSGVVAFIVGSAVCVFLYGNGWLQGGYNGYVFQRALYKQVDSNKPIIVISDLTSFQWDKVCLYCPYDEGNDAALDDGIHVIKFTLNDKKILRMDLRGDLFNEPLMRKSAACFGANAAFVVKNKSIESMIVLNKAKSSNR